MQSEGKDASCSSSPSKIPVFANFGSWATHRSGRGKFNVSDIDPMLCDFLLYAFFDISERGTVTVLDPKPDLEDDGGQGNIRRLEELKRVNPSLKTLASIGGDKVPASIFSQVAASSSLRSALAINARRFFKAHGFDGVDIAWQYPGDSDRWNSVQLLRVLASELHGAELILTVAVIAVAQMGLWSCRVGFETCRGLNKPNKWKNLETTMQSEGKDASCSSSPSKKPVFAYFGSWAAHRSGRGKFNVSDIDPMLCDYLLYAFFGISERGTVTVLDPKPDLEDDGGMGNIRRLEELKRVNPSLKTLASIGGDKVPASIFSQVAASSSLRSAFANNARRFCKAHGFDGVDISWQYPGDGDRRNFVQLLRGLATELHGAGLILTVAVGASEPKALESYDINCIARHVDYILLMTYDYNGSWDSYTGHNAPLYAGPTDTTEFQQKLNIDHSMQHWLREGAPAHKLILGVPTYGRSFHLSNVLGYGVRAPSDDAGDAGPYTKEAGVLAYYEVLENLQNGWIKTRDDKQKVPYAHSEDQWMSYDDSESVADKCKYAVNRNLGGVMIWTIDLDDFRGNFGRSYPLLKTINQCL